VDDDGIVAVRSQDADFKKGAVPGGADQHQEMAVLEPRIDRVADGVPDVFGRDAVLEC
jgi:hypothetical protein